MTAAALQSAAPRAAVPRAPLHALRFAGMGTRVRLLASAPGPLCTTRAEVERLAARLTRFDPASELPAQRGPAPHRPRLRRPARRRPGGAARRAADRRPRRPDAARGARARGLRAVAVRRPALLAPYGPCAVDCGGDMRVTGAHSVLVEHPFGGEPAASIALRDGAVAASGVDARLWGSTAHHLLDPATGAPAWTGVVTATALAPTAAEAEARAKAALLAGPHAGRALLAHGGVLIFDDGTAHIAAGAAPAASRPGAAPAARLAQAVDP